MHRSLVASLVAGLSLLASAAHAQTQPPVPRPNPAEPVFSAQLSADQHALLNWRVSPKHAPLYFEVERSKDGRSYSVADRQPYQVSDFPSFDKRGRVRADLLPAVPGGPRLLAHLHGEQSTTARRSPGGPSYPYAAELTRGPTPLTETGHVATPATIDLRVRRAKTGELVAFQTVPYENTQVCWGNLRHGQYVLEAESVGRTWVTKLTVR